MHPISNLLDETVGECYLTAKIGTPAQIHSYVNNPQEKTILIKEA
jgi:hypothetical protein